MLTVTLINPMDTEDMISMLEIGTLALEELEEL